MTEQLKNSKYTDDKIIASPLHTEFYTHAILMRTYSTEGVGAC